MNYIKKVYVLLPAVKCARQADYLHDFKAIQKTQVPAVQNFSDKAPLRLTIVNI
jgi:hypothetical protein